MKELFELLKPSIFETLYMVSASMTFTILLGMPLGIILVVTEENHILKNTAINNVLSYVINFMRSLPFVILMISIIPFTKLIVGTTIGTKAAIVPLIIASVPFFARIVESSLKEIDYGVIEASIAMGASPFEIITKVMIPEAMSSLVLGITITIINIIGYSAMAGVVGGGGLGDLAIRYGYHRFRTNIMIATVLVLILIVQVTQSLGTKLSSSINKK